MPLFSPITLATAPPSLSTHRLISKPMRALQLVSSRFANYSLPSILVNQEEKLASARKSAADGYLSSYTIALLAEPETLVQTAKLNWVLRFPLPPPNPQGTRRFSATPSYNHGPRTRWCAPLCILLYLRYSSCPHSLDFLLLTTS